MICKILPLGELYTRLCDTRLVNRYQGMVLSIGLNGLIETLVSALNPSAF
jgi:hypothetical protein